MPDVLNGQYMMYLEPFSPKSGQQPATLRDHVITTLMTPLRFLSSCSQIQRHRSFVYTIRLGMHHPCWEPNRGMIVFLVSRATYGRKTRLTLLSGPTRRSRAPVWSRCRGPNTEQVRARLLCPIPQCYVGLCKNGTYTPQTFWTDVIGQIRQDQLTVNCNVLVNWACVASTYGPPDATRQPTFPLAVDGGLCVPLADEQLAAHHWNWVVEDLPALGHTGTTLE
jgi:hypothetical protein